MLELDAVPWLRTVQRHWPVIERELARTPSWERWTSDQPDPGGHCAFLSGQWTVHPVYFGRYDAASMARGRPDWQGRVQALTAGLPITYPETTALLRPLAPVNYAAFTRLHGKSRLAPHRHRNPESLILHLGLVIPRGETSGLRVADRIHVWTKPGDAVVFNDTLEHSAWNDSDTDRILFYLDFQAPPDLRPGDGD
jgi:hypothetical protein